jgi:uncharacterized protein (TIGR01777 family)
MSIILITGATGLIGSRLREMLLKKGHIIKTIGRPVNGQTKDAYTWEPDKGHMNENALKGVGTIIHLAGAGVADSRWTKARKQEIISSRIQSTRLLYDTLSRTPNHVRTIISASASGYYGDGGSVWLTEDMAPADTFLAEVTRQWESEVARFEAIGIRHVSCRIGIVLSDRGGALPELMRTMPLGVAGYFAKEPLYYPWVHIDDVCGAFIHAAEHSGLRGSYNVNAPEPLTIKDLMKEIIDARQSRALLMPVPSFALRLAMGEMAEMLLSSQRCSSSKLRGAGYKFTYPTIGSALKEIFTQDKEGQNQ